MTDTSDARDHAYRRHQSLITERSSWLGYWQDLSAHIAPRSARFLTGDLNKGAPGFNRIYDNTATRAWRTLAAGMMSGMTSPARPWFKLSVANQDLSDAPAVKLWLARETQRMLTIFAASNTYQTFHALYEDEGLFGTGCAIMMDDFDDVIHDYHSPVGEFCIATDFKGRVNTISREFTKTVSALVAEFGIDNVSPSVRGLYDAGKYDVAIPVVHVVAPRANRDTTRKDAKNKAYSSIYFEPGGGKTTILRESGYDEFCAIAPRWSKIGGETYGLSPAMDAIGDIKQLQVEQLHKARGIHSMVDPHKFLPTSAKGAGPLNPGGISYIDNPTGEVSASSQVNLRLDYLLEDIRDVRERIHSAFYTDLFLMLANSTDQSKTATEVAELHEEKMLMLGPVIERVGFEMLAPKIEHTFARMVSAGIVSRPPPELEGAEIKIEYTSVLAQAQRAIGVNPVDRFVGSLGVVAQYKPEVLDKFDADEWADIYADRLGVDPRIIVASDKVAIIRKQRADAQAQAEQNAQMNMAADTAQKVAGAGAHVAQNPQMQDLLGQFQGYGSPSAEMI